MMKKINKIALNVAILATTIYIFSGCNDDFLKEMENYSKTTDVIYDDYEGALGRIDNLYVNQLPVSTSGISYYLPSAGTSDITSQSTEEYSGLSNYVNSGVNLSNENVDDYFYNEYRTSRNPYGRIRNCNDIIEGITNGSIPDDKKGELLGQAYFFRAWMYYLLVKTYGGVPIVTSKQNPTVAETEALITPRSTTKECINFICDDLEKAAKILPIRWNGANYGRVTAGAALALQGRARLLYASPLFNRADDNARWELAYRSNKNALDTLSIGGFRLAYLDTPGKNGSGWAKMFSDYESPEAVFVTLYNNLENTNKADEIWKNNGWESSIRPKNANGGGGKNATNLIVDLFPMADGKKPTEAGGSYAYDPDLFFLNRDPRFYRTFAFPGVTWKFDGNPTSINAIAYPYDGKDYVLWNYIWFTTAGAQTSPTGTGYGADGLGESYKGIYIRKRTNDFDIDKTPTVLYRWNLQDGNSFAWSAAPYMEIRYAEVLLNFAEAACGAGHLSEAVNALKDIRKRAGLPEGSSGLYGLDPSIISDRAKLFSAILYERQIELAYEGKRFDDMRRWLLWDGGQGQANLNPSWALVGFSGNTCTYLGLTPFNGKRRDGIEVYVAGAAGIAEAKPENDPLKNVRPTPLNLRTDNLTKGDGTTPIDLLATFYVNNLKRKTRQGDEASKMVDFKPQYYIIGLKKSAQTNNPSLLQTIGWTDSQRGSMGTFDPLAE